jgi:hypothetical protein
LQRRNTGSVDCQRCTTSIDGLERVFQALIVDVGVVDSDWLSRVEVQ